MDGLQAFVDPPMDRGLSYPIGMKQEIACSDSARILSANIDRLMSAHTALNSNTKLGKKASVGVATLSRLRTGNTEATLGILERLAQAFDLQAWQLLVPDLDPGNPPMLRVMTETETELYKRLKSLAAQIIDLDPPSST